MAAADHRDAVKNTPSLAQRSAKTLLKKDWAKSIPMKKIVEVAGEISKQHLHFPWVSESFFISTEASRREKVIRGTQGPESPAEWVSSESQVRGALIMVKQGWPQGRPWPLWGLTWCLRKT